MGPFFLLLVRRLFVPRGPQSVPRRRNQVGPRTFAGSSTGAVGRLWSLKTKWADLLCRKTPHNQLTARDTDCPSSILRLWTQMGKGGGGGERTREPQASKSAGLKTNCIRAKSFRRQRQEKDGPNNGGGCARDEDRQDSPADGKLDRAPFSRGIGGYNENQSRGPHRDSCLLPMSFLNVLLLLLYLFSLRLRPPDLTGLN